MRTALSTIFVFAALLLALSPANAARVLTTRTHLDTLPTGAEIFLIGDDGSEIRQGKTPIKNLRLPRGDIKLKFVKEGYEPLIQELRIATTIQNLVFNMQRSIKDGQLELISGDTYHGAQVKIDGREVGTLPLKTAISPGRHQVIIEKDGYRTWERWLDVHEAQFLTLDVILISEGEARAEILVTSNPSGARVIVNGERHGQTPTVIENLTPGAYLLEVQLDGYKSVSQTITAKPGERAIVDAALSRAEADTGELKILADMEDVTVFLDARRLGPAPRTEVKLEPGIYTVVGESPRGFSATMEAEVQPNEVTVVRLEMQEDTSVRALVEPARLRLLATSDRAEGRLDQGTWRPLPSAFRDLTPGDYLVEVRAPGFGTWQAEITLEPGAKRELLAELEAAGQLRVETVDQRAAELFLNGRSLGRVPYHGEIPTGRHTLLVQADDGEQEEFTIEASPDRLIEVDVAFEAEAIRKRARRQMPYSARALAPGLGYASFFVSWWEWAFPISLQAGVGIGYDMDVSLQFRTAFDVINEFEAIYKWQFAETEYLAAAAEGGIGGGVGALSRNSFFFRATAKGSAFIKDIAAFTARFGLLYHTDRLGPENVPSTRYRDAGVRMYIGLNTEIYLTEMLNLELMVEMDPLGDNRRIYTTGFLNDPDPKFYFGIGLSFFL